MQKKFRRIGSSLGFLVLLGLAFSGGRALRDIGTVHVPTMNASVQANAMLKFTPEFPPVTVAKAASATSENRELVLYVVRLLKSYYVEPITAERETGMARGAARGMLDSLADPDSHFIDPGERKLLDDAGDGRFYGMGAVLAVKRQKTDGMDSIRIVVVAPMPGGPAEKAGLKAGDSITHVDGKWIVTWNPFDEPELAKLAKARINGDVSDDYRKAVESAAKKLAEGVKATDVLETLTSKQTGQVALSIDREGQSKPIQMKVDLGTTTVPSIKTKTLKNNILCIRVTQFSPHAAQEFAKQINLAMSSSSKPKALILDLRNNPGGLMDSASTIAGRIDGGGDQAIIQEKNRRDIIKAVRSHKLGLPVVVLVNGGTASVAELTAGTLRESISATIVGTRTFGDGMAQKPMVLKDGSEAILTTGKMLTPRGYDFEGKGIVPDKVVEEDQRHGDAQLTAAEQMLLKKLGKV